MKSRTEYLTMEVPARRGFVDITHESPARAARPEEPRREVKTT